MSNEVFEEKLPTFGDKINKGIEKTITNGQDTEHWNVYAMAEEHD